MTALTAVPGTAVDLARHTFRAMGTDVELFLAGGSGAHEHLETAEAELRRLETVFSRFLPDSELSRLNRTRSRQVSGELFEVVESALAAREATGGRFDPTVHDALVVAGYDRTFDDVGSARSRAAVSRCGGAVRVDVASRRIDLAPGVHLDLGGIAKGYAVDRICELLAEHGSCLVNAGGDLAVDRLLGGEPWPIAVERPEEAEPLVVALADGGLATSGTDRRRWLQEGRERHHLIDPRTSEPVETDLLRVTAAGASAVEAEIWAKALLLVGEREAAAEAGARRIPCVLVTTDGRTRLEGGLA